MSLLIRAGTACLDFYWPASINAIGLSQTVLCITLVWVYLCYDTDAQSSRKFTWSLSGLWCDFSIARDASTPDETALQAFRELGRSAEAGGRCTEVGRVRPALQSSADPFRSSCSVVERHFELLEYVMLHYHITVILHALPSLLTGRQQVATTPCMAGSRALMSTCTIKVLSHHRDFNSWLSPRSWPERDCPF